MSATFCVICQFDKPNGSARSLGPSSIPSLGDGVMLGTAWIDRPVDTRGCTPASTSSSVQHGSAAMLKPMIDIPRVFAMPQAFRTTRTADTVERRSVVGKLAAILVSDVVGYSRLTGADEDRTLARLRGLRSDLIDPLSPSITDASSSAPATAAIIEFRSVVDAVRCAHRSAERPWSSATQGSRPTSASSFASAFTWATSSRRATAT